MSAETGNDFEVDLVPDIAILQAAGYHVLAHDLRNFGLSGAANGGQRSQSAPKRLCTPEASTTPAGSPTVENAAGGDDPRPRHKRRRRRERESDGSMNPHEQCGERDEKSQEGGNARHRPLSSSIAAGAPSRECVNAANTAVMIGSGTRSPAKWPESP